MLNAIVIALLATTSTLAIAGTARAQDSNLDCEVAAAAVAARQVELAIKDYLSVASHCAGAANALRVLNDQRLVRDRALADADRAVDASQVAGVSAQDAVRDIAEARTAYLAALTADAASTPARDGLANLDATPTATDAFAGTRALLDAGLKKEAREQLTKDLAAGHSLGSGKADQQLRELATDTSGQNWWDDVRSYLTDILGFLGWMLGILIGAGLALFIALAAINLFVLDPARRDRHRRPTLDPAAGGLTRWWRVLTQPRLSIVPAGDEGSKQLAFRLRTTLRHLDHSDGLDQIRFATVPEQRLDLASIGDIDARLKPIMAAMTLAGQRDTVTVTVTTSADDKMHPRVGAEAFARKQEGRSATYMSETAVEEAPAPDLIGMIAGWLLFNAEEMRPRLREGPDVKAVYGTASQSSYSAYLGGLEKIAVGDLVGARSLLVAAVGFDVNNLRSQLNLAVVELMDPDPAVRDIGLDRLDALLVEGVSG